MAIEHVITECNYQDHLRDPSRPITIEYEDHLCSTAVFQDGYASGDPDFHDLYIKRPGLKPIKIPMDHTQEFYLREEKGQKVLYARYHAKSGDSRDLKLGIVPETIGDSIKRLIAVANGRINHSTTEEIEVLVNSLDMPFGLGDGI